MNRRYLSQIGATLGLVLFSFLSPGIAHAAPQDITMSPTSLSQIIQPGSSYSGSFQVINQGQVSYPFQVYATPYHVSGEDYTPDFTILPNAPNVISWIKFSTKGTTIAPGQTVTVGYTISVPKNTQPGGYYAVAFAETNFPKTGSSITLNDRVGEIFYIQAAGPVVKKGELLTWQTAMFQKPPITASLRIENNGAVNFPATINLKVEDIFGQSKYTLHTIKQILPQTIRKVTIPWNETPSIGIFKVSGSVSFLNQNNILQTKWILVMSPTVRMIVISLAAVIIIFYAVRITYSLGSRRSSKKSSGRR